MVRNHYFVNDQIGWQSVFICTMQGYMMISMAQPWLVLYLIPKVFTKGTKFFHIETVLAKP